MKRAFLSMVLCIALVVAVNLGTVAELPRPAAEIRSENDITFRNYNWYAPFSVVHEEMKALSGYSWESVYSNTTIDYYYGAEWQLVYSGDQIEEGGVRAYYYNIPIAGYVADSAVIYYMYPLGEDGRVIRDDVLSELYCAQYEFEEMADKNAQYNDLKGKITGLYGEGRFANTKYINSIKWFDKSNNVIWLIAEIDQNRIRLVYAAGDSNERLDALQKQITAEKVEAEALTRSENANNTDGL